MSDEIKKDESAVPSFVFVGQFSSGKTTYSDRLKTLLEIEFGITVYRPSFSAKIQKIANELFGMKEYDRTLLQTIANKMREIDPAVWANYIIKDALSNGKLPVIIDGARKQEELDALRRHIPGIIVVRLTANKEQLLEAYKKKRGSYPTQEQWNNLAETSIDYLDADITLHNDYTVEGMDRQLKAIMNAIRNNTLPRIEADLQ